MKRFLQSTLILLLFCFTTEAQDSWGIIDNQSAESGIKVVNINTGLSWSLDPSQRIQMNQSNNPIFDFLFNSYYAFNFSESGLPVKGKEGWSVYDQNGEIIFATNQYTRILPMRDGLYKAHEKIEGQNATMIYYLDKKGKRALKEKSYWEASAFSEGLAVVQLVDKNGPWQIINKKGKNVGSFPEKYAPYISSVEPFSNGLTMVSLKRPRGYDRKSFVYQKIYFDKKGKEVLNVSEITKTELNNNAIPFKNGLAYSTNYNQYYLYNNEGKIIKKFDVLLGITKITKHHFLTNNGTAFNNLYNHLGENVILPAKKDVVLITNNITDQYLGVLHIDTLTKTKEYVVHDALTYKPLFTTDEFVLGLLEDKILIGKGTQYVKELAKIVDINNKLIYETNAKDRLFTSITEALKFKSEVENLEISHRENIEALSQFKNLKVLKIKFINISTLPDLSVLTNLEYFSIMGCDNIKTLPVSLNSLKQIKELHISDCKSLTGIENLIDALPNLSKVYSMNYNFPDGYEKKLKAERPKIRFSNWHSMGDDEIIIEESDVMEITPPSPPPPSATKK